jgi:maltooligosyltrehalose trehalohydrolase
MPRRHGPRLTARGVSFSVFAPNAPQLSLRWKDRTLAMERSPDGFFTLEVEGAAPGDRYAFVFPDGRERPDPATRRQPEGVHAASQIFDVNRFRWTDSAWRGVRLEELTIYELHLGTFTEEGTFDAALARLPELVSLGITCVELMPVQPFPGTRNWGYDGAAPYGVQESYGGPEALQRFVDRAHALGVAVCLDVVYNHMGPEGNYLRDFGPYFTSRHKSPWGDGLNFDGEGAEPIRRFMVDAAAQWVRDFHVDALRLDAVHAIQDDSRRHLVGEITDALREISAATQRQIHVIAESDLNDRKVVEPTPRGWGVSTVWADDLHHAIHTFLTGERASFYADYGSAEQIQKALAEGFVYQGQHSKFRKAPHGTPTTGLPPSRFVVCSQNHDQVGNRPAGERLSTLVPREALKPIAALTILGSALPMIFMGEEYGETRPFLYFTSHTDPQLAKNVSEGRRKEFIACGGTGEAPDPQAESTLVASRLSHRRDGEHGALWQEYQRLFTLRKRHLAHIRGAFPRVETRGGAFELRWPVLVVTVNLGPTPELGVSGWSYSVRET